MHSRSVLATNDRSNPSHPLSDAVESQVWKTVTIHQFPDGVEVFIDEAHRTWSDGADFEGIDKPEKAERGEGDREKNIERAARRAKTQVRRRCKAIRANCLLTLTYREDMRDVVRAQRDFKAFRERLSTLGQFEYIATLERQEGHKNGNLSAQPGRSSIHIHIACQQFPAYLRDEHGVRVKSYNLIRAMWRRVVGRDNGNVDLTKPRGRNSAHRIASYIGKYVAKQMDAGLNKKKYWSSRGIVLPKPEKHWFPGDMDTFDIVVQIAKQFELNGYSDICQYADGMNQFLWFSASRPGV
ncbi:hypothetical protein [uncultured Oxalicibacterium sp.]|uniref:rolling circle replication-associated protein n=1 Tax=uncultured Oxalicibacterium sp. TaxID=1168540 RepID=UPI0025F505B0|nr:hypothetical protein [uncultured Oxalicibacterium sp.]